MAKFAKFFSFLFGILEGGRGNNEFSRNIPRNVRVFERFFVIMHKNQLANLLFKVINSSTDSVVVTDARRPDNPIIFANPAFERLTGYASAEIEGRNCRFLQGSDRDQRAVRRLRGAIVIGVETRQVLRNYRKDGSIFYNELSVSPVYDRQGRVQYFVGMQHEVDAAAWQAAGEAAR